MTDLTDHIIHTADGRLHPKASTTNADVERIVAKAVANNAAGGMVVHFHGGLVSEKSARESASKRLYPLYADKAQAYPIFFVWESGFLEAPFNNLREIGKERLFRAFVKKAGLWALKKVGGLSGFKGTAIGAVDEQTLNREFDDWFSGKSAEPPRRLETLPGAALPEARTKGVALDEERLAEEIEPNLLDDDEFQAALSAAFNGIPPGATPRPSLKGTGSTIAESSALSKEAAERLFDTQPGTTKGSLSLFKAAKVVAAIVIRSIRRSRRGRAHGGYLTVVEEVLRELYVDKLGREVWWDRMKGDTADAFREGDEYGGTAFLAALRAQQEAGKTLPKITLVGHSTGAIYICNFLRAANRMLPSVKFNVIFEAPAVSHDVLAQTVAQQGAMISSFRSFGMSDASEQDDDLVPIIYPASLLYFVSGLLEHEVDLPLVGMQRFLIQDVFGSDDFWSIEVCQKFFARHPDALIWAPHDGGPGKCSNGKSHPDFDDADSSTMDSVAHIIKTQASS